LTRKQKTYFGVKTASLTNGVGNTRLSTCRTEVRSLPLNLYKNQLKVIKDLSVTLEILKVLEEKHRGNISRYIHRQ
jgi:hypothetical protein